MILRFFTGLIIAALGTLMILKTEPIFNFVGRIPTAEKYLGSGGSRLFIKLIGILIIFGGLMWGLGLWEGFLQATIGSLFPKSDIQ
jgi:hypothetical protein